MLCTSMKEQYTSANLHVLYRLNKHSTVSIQPQGHTALYSITTNYDELVANPALCRNKHKNALHLRSRL